MSSSTGIVPPKKKNKTYGDGEVSRDGNMLRVVIMMMMAVVVGEGWARHWQVHDVKGVQGQVATVDASHPRAVVQALVRTLGGKNSNQMRLGRRSGTTVSR